MAKSVLTERGVRAASVPDGKSEAVLYDGGNLVLRVRPSTGDGGGVRKTWQFWYVRGGQRQRIGLGSWPDVSLTAARAKADHYHGLLAAGVTPTMATPAAVEGRPLIPRTVKELAERWKADYLAHRRKDKGEAVAASLALHVFPHIGSTRLVEVRKLHVLHVVNGLTAAGKGRTARLVLATLRQLFRWGQSQDFPVVDPTVGLDKAKVGAKEVSRSRVLSPAEIQDLAKRLQATKRGGPDGRQRDIPALPLATQAACWVMLASLARVGELSQARWEHIDTEAKTWMVPAENAKNGQAHVIHLSGFAARHLAHLRQYAAGSAWVLPGRDIKDHLDPKAITKQLTDRQRTEVMKGRSSDATALVLPGGRWSSHDLRRTGATMMQGLGVAAPVIERCLNHVEEDRMVRTYQRDDLLPQRREAFEKLGQRLDELVPEQATAHLRVGR